MGNSATQFKATGKAAGKARGAAAGRAPARRAAAAAPSFASSGLGWREAVERTVTGLHYEVVEVERALRGLLRVTIDRIPGQAYGTGAGESVLVEDCELVTRQLQYALEVDGVDYARLEVSSPGLDRPLKREADYQRFAGQAVSITLKEPFQGRKVFKGVLGRAEDGAGWSLVFSDGKDQQVLTFALDEVRDARLVPVVDFKGRQGKTTGAAPQAAAAGEEDGGQVR